jgi:hypothetical protein
MGTVRLTRSVLGGLVATLVLVACAGGGGGGVDAGDTAFEAGSGSESTFPPAAPPEPVAIPSTFPVTTFPPRTTTAEEATGPTQPPYEPPPIVEPLPERVCATVRSPGGQVQSGWEARWLTEPAVNDALTLEVCLDDRTPDAGQAVTATITATDPDAELDGPCAALVAWEGSEACGGPDGAPGTRQPTPAEVPGRVATTRTHTYAAPGSFSVVASSTSGPCCVGHPYASTASNTFLVEVG